MLEGSKKMKCKNEECKNKVRDFCSYSCQTQHEKPGLDIAGALDLFLQGHVMRRQQWPSGWHIFAEIPHEQFHKFDSHIICSWEKGEKRFWKPMIRDIRSMDWEVYEAEVQIDLPEPSGGSERLCPLCRFSDDCGMFDALTDTRQAMICKNFSPKPSTRVPCEKCRHFSTCEVKKFMGKTTLSMTCGGFELAGMTFKTAVEAMKVGKKVRRAKWLKERCIHAKPGASSISDLNDSYWTPNPDDFEATDWEMVN